MGDLLFRPGQKLLGLYGECSYGLAGPGNRSLYSEQETLFIPSFIPFIHTAPNEVYKADICQFSVGWMNESNWRLARTPPLESPPRLPEAKFEAHSPGLYQRLPAVIVFPSLVASSTWGLLGDKAYCLWPSICGGWKGHRPGVV